VLARSGPELFDLLRGGQGVLSIVLGMDKIVSEVDAAIMEIEARRAGLAAHPSAGAGPSNGRGAATGS
jgi:hypothetical protein